MMRIVVAVLLLMQWPSVAQAQKRFALLIGNQAYTGEIGALANPHNDIALLQKTLKGLGFEVAVEMDASLGSLTRAVNAYARRLKLAGTDAVGFFYYSGHGAADGQANYLIPIDVKTADDGDLWDQSLRLTEITRKLKTEAGNATHFVVFDACRNVLKLKKPGSRSLVQSKGFAAVAQENGMLIAYATAEGELASDVGAGAGPYARVLAEEIVKPGVEAVAMFRVVQRRVRTAINQEPYLGFSALGDVYLAGAEASKPPGSPQSALSEAAQTWALIKDSANVSVLEAFARQFGDTVYGALARARIEELKKQQVAVAAPPPAPAPKRDQPTSPASPQPPAADRAEPPLTPRVLNAESRFRLATSFPKSMTEYFDPSEQVAKDVLANTGQKLTLRVFAAGEIVPGLQVLDAVGAGTVDFGWTFAGFYWGKNPAFGIAGGGVPVGLNASAFLSWLEGSGRAPRDALFAAHGAKAIPCSIIGPKGLWLRKELRTADDLKGSKIRVGGAIGAVLMRLGAVPQQIAGGDIYPALERGTIDGTEFATPVTDEKLGFYKITRYYHYPVWEPTFSGIVDLIVNKTTWDGLEPAAREVLEGVCRRQLRTDFDKIDADAAPALARLIERGVAIRRLPASLEARVRQASEEYFAEQLKDPTFRAVWSSMPPRESAKR
jgi:TRAP-type mannitol/chloroaromatic compound transport system substrate-binding protein